MFKHTQTYGVDPILRVQLSGNEPRVSDCLDKCLHICANECRVQTRKPHCIQGCDEECTQNCPDDQSTKIHKQNMVNVRVQSSQQEQSDDEVPENDNLLESQEWEQTVIRSEASKNITHDRTSGHSLFWLHLTCSC